MSYSVLLISNNSSEHSGLAAAFSAVGVCLSVVPNAEECQAYLSGVGIYGDRGLYPMPQLILLDLDVSNELGFEVLKWRRTEPAFNRIPAMALTSSREPTPVEQAYALGASSCLLKSKEVIPDLAKGIRDYAALLKKDSGGAAWAGFV
jgi:two-component system, response regulator